MAQSRTIEEFIKNLKFKKKTMGGCDEEDVLLKMKELSDLYRETSQSMREELEKANSRVQEIQSELMAARSKLKESQEQLAEKDGELSDVKNQLTQANSQLYEAKSRLAETSQKLSDAEERLMLGNREPVYRPELKPAGSRAYEDRLDALDKMITSIEGTKEDIIRRAKMEAQQEADDIRRRTMILKDEREKMSWELRKNFDFMSVEFDKMHELLKMLQDKMKRLADAYEQDSE